MSNIIWLFLLPMALTVAIGIYMQDHPLPSVEEFETKMDELVENHVLRVHFWDHVFPGRISGMSEKNE